MDKRILKRIEDRELQIKILKGTQVIQGIISIIGVLVDRHKFKKLDDEDTINRTKRTRISQSTSSSILGYLITQGINTLVIKYLEEQQRKDKSLLPEHFDYKFDKDNNVIKNGHKEDKIAKQVEELLDNNDMKEIVKKYQNKD